MPKLPPLSQSCTKGVTPTEYKSERQRRGSQQKVSVLLGVHRVTVAKREAGMEPISREAWLALCSLPLPRKKRGPKKGHNSD